MEYPKVRIEQADNGFIVYHEGHRKIYKTIDEAMNHAKEYLVTTPIRKHAKEKKC